MSNYIHQKTVESPNGLVEVYTRKFGNDLIKTSFHSMHEAKKAFEQTSDQSCMGGDSLPNWKLVVNGDSKDGEWIGFGKDEDQCGLPCPKNQNDFVQMLYSPWSKGIEIVDSFYNEMKESELNKPRDRRRVVNWSDDNGDDVCRDKLHAGQPFWRTTKRRLSAGPASITFFVQVGVLSERHWSETLWRVASAVAAAELLEERGYNVAITAVSHSADTFTKGSSCNVNKLTSINLKEHGQAIDRCSMLNAMSCWAFRTFWFQLFGYAVEVGAAAELNSGLGRTKTIGQQECELLTNDPASFVFQHTLNKGHAVQAAQAAINVVGSDDWFEWDDDYPLK